MGVSTDKVLYFALEETRLKQRVENSLLRHEFIADCISYRLRESLSMSRNHSLRPDCDTEKFYCLVGMKQHPDCQPGCAKTVNGSDDNDCDSDQDFESKRIDDAHLVLFNTKMDAKRCSQKASNW